MITYELWNYGEPVGIGSVLPRFQWEDYGFFSSHLLFSLTQRSLLCPSQHFEVAFALSMLRLTKYTTSTYADFLYYIFPYNVLH